MKKGTDWRGFNVVVVTPFTSQGEIDDKSFLKNIDLVIEDGATGVVVSGCTGEFWALSLEERKHLFKLASDHLKGKVTLICGVSAVRTDEVLELADAAKQAKADGVMLMPPHGVVCTDRELIELYSVVSDSIGIPILVYNLPSRVINNITPQLMDRLADIENVVAIKEASNDVNQIIETLRLAGDRISVFIGYETGALPGIVMGAEGITSIIPQVLGKAAIDLCFYSLAGEIEKARPLQFMVFALYNGMVGVGNFPAWWKEAMNQLGRPAGYPRPPQLPLTQEEKNRVTQVLKELGLL